VPFTWNGFWPVGASWGRPATVCFAAASCEAAV